MASTYYNSGAPRKSRDLPKAERLCGRERIGELFRAGGGGAAGKVAARALPNADGETRLAAIAGKSLGNAVKRNRMRQRLRAAFRMQKDKMPKGWDLALLARPGLLEAEWLELCRDAVTAAERAVRGATGPRRLPPHP